MAYIEVDGQEIWHDDRQPTWIADPLRRAAETLAMYIERAIYQQKLPDGTVNPHWMSPEYIAWQIARYDAAKNGSGNAGDYVDYDPDVRSNDVSPVPAKGPRIDSRIPVPASCEVAFGKPTITVDGED